MISRNAVQGVVRGGGFGVGYVVECDHRGCYLPVYRDGIRSGKVNVRTGEVSDAGSGALKRSLSYRAKQELRTLARGI